MPLLMDGMIERLISKEQLYEPMKQVAEKILLG
jgi:Pex19 protein family